MRRPRRRALIVLGMLAAALSSCAVSRPGTPITFRNVTPETPMQIPGSLVRPAGKGPFPALVLLHGCAGVEPFYFRWAEWLAERGYAALVVDSFGPRRVDHHCRSGPDEPPITARLDDAFGALRYLQAQPWVRGDRVAAMGWSQGGVYSMAVINGPSLERARQRGVQLPPVGFAAAVAMYPGGCESLVKELVVRPLLLLIGRADDWTPAAHCEQMVNAMRSRGADVTIFVYPGAYHYFDKEGQRKEVQAGVENDESPTGFGATVGYQAEADRDAHRRVEVFLARHLGR